VSEATKRCSKCREEKPLSAFTRDCTKTTGYHSHCKDCRRIWRAERNEAGQTNNYRMVKRWRDKHREHWLAVDREKMRRYRARQRAEREEAS